MGKTERIVSKVIHVLGCSYALVITACIMAVFQMLFREFGFERLLHLGQEILFCISHIFIIALVDLTDRPWVCRGVGLGIQVCFMGAAILRSVEALQVYCVRTNLVFGTGFLPFKLVAGFTLRKFGHLCVDSCEKARVGRERFEVMMMSCGAAVAWKWSDAYQSNWTCFLNLDNGTAVVVWIFLRLTPDVFAIMFIEATAQMPLPPLPQAKRSQWITA